MSSARDYYFLCARLCAGFGESAAMVGDAVRKAGKDQILGGRPWEEWEGSGICWDANGRF